MAGRHGSKRNHPSSKAKARRRRRVIGLGTGAGAVLAFGLGPLGVAPAAHADGLDVILDPIINSLSSVDPTLGADVSAVLGDFTSSWDSVGADLVGWIRRWGRPAAGPVWFPTLARRCRSADVSSADSSGALAQTLEQDWVTSQFGTQVDNAINSYADKVDPSLVGDSCGLICNGADGESGGTLTEADGQNGGVWIGDGGNGGTDAAGDGGNGGTSGDFGGNAGNGGAAGPNDGNGGNGGDCMTERYVPAVTACPAPTGGNGGNGGNGGSTSGDGGTGGAGGAGSASVNDGAGGNGGNGGNAEGQGNGGCRRERRGGHVRRRRRRH